MIILIGLLMYYFFMVDEIALIFLNVAIIVGMTIFAFVLNKIRPERDTSIIIQVIFSIVLVMSIVFFTMMIFTEDGDGSDTGKESAPLTITDYRDSNDVIEDVSVYLDKNIFGSRSSYFVFGEKHAIIYDVYKSEYAWILDRIWKEEFIERNLDEEVVDCTMDWDAEKAFRNSVGTYYVRYENTILIFNDDEDVYLSEEQIDIILEKLELR